MTWIKLSFFILYIYCDIYRILKEEIVDMANHNKENFHNMMSLKKETKGLYIKYSFRSRLICNNIIKYSIHHSSNYFQNKISMCVLNRNAINISEKKNQVLLLDLCAKSLGIGKNIFKTNIFTIFDITKLSLKYIASFILPRISKYCYEVDILFYDESGILHNQLIVESLFNDEKSEKENWKLLKIFYLLKHDINLPNWLSTYKSNIEIFLECHLKHFKGYALEVIYNNNIYTLKRVDISPNLFIGIERIVKNFDNTIDIDDIRILPNSLYFKRTCITSNQIEIKIDIKGYQPTDHYAIQLKNMVKNLDNLIFLTVINIQHTPFYSLENFHKTIEIVYIKEIVDIKNAFKKRIIIYEDYIYFPFTEFIFLEDLDQKIIDIDMNPEVRNVLRNFNNMIHKIKVNLRKVFQPFNFLKSKFHITTKNWLKNETIILQGKLKKYYLSLNLKNRTDLGELIFKFMTGLKTQQIESISPFIFDLPSHCIDSNDFSNFIDSRNTMFYENLSIHPELKIYQKYFNSIGFSIAKKGPFYINHIFMFIVPAIVFEYNSYDTEKRINLFKTKIGSKIELFNNNEKLLLSQYIEYFLNNELIQDIPINILRYTHMAHSELEPLLTKSLDMILDFKLFNQFVKLDKTITKCSLRYISLRKLLLDLLIWSVTEIINDLFLVTCNKKSIIVFQKEYDYYEDIFDKLILAADNFFEIEKNIAPKKLEVHDEIGIFKRLHEKDETMESENKRLKYN